MTIAIATCRELPDGDEDAGLLRTALSDRGLAGEWRDWRDPAVDWAGYDLVIIRSTWDYTSDLQTFLDWAARVPRLDNPLPVLTWNTDKVYLRDLAAAGVPVVPTSWAGPGEPVELPAAGEFVVKPSVGAGSKGAGRFAAGDRTALDHAARLHEAGRTVMVQPYLGQVDTDGETALIYLDGRFSHAIRKGAMLPELSVNELDVQYSRSLYVDERITARTPSKAELALGEAALGSVRDRFGGDLLYARVDLLPTSDGPVVIELELVEPSLFLEFADGGADRLADAIAGRLVRPTV
jgi:hypothetical protein